MAQSYLTSNSGAFVAGWTKHLSNVFGQEELATRVIERVRLAQEHLENAFGVKWRGKQLLDLGCGQMLRHALVFAQHNDVTGIDRELPFRPPYVIDAIRSTYSCGVHRAVKTLVRQLLGVDMRYRRALTHALGIRALRRPSLSCMDAKKLRFADESFDGAYSISTFQHIDEPQMAAREMARILKPEAVAYIDLHLYTSRRGSEHPHLTTSENTYPPWGHLRPSSKYYGKHGLYVNALRLHEWKALLECVFDEVQYIGIEAEKERDRRYLTDAVRAELNDYSEEELLTSTLIAVCRKGSN